MAEEITLDVSDFNPARSAQCDYGDDRVSSDELMNLQRLVDTGPPCVQQFVQQAEAQFADSKSADFYEGQLSAFTQIMSLIRTVGERYSSRGNQLPLLQATASFISALVLSQSGPSVRRVRAQRTAKERERIHGKKTDSG